MTLTTTDFDGTRHLNGKIPTIRINEPPCDVLVVSLGASRDDCNAIAVKIAAYLESVR